MAKSRRARHLPSEEAPVRLPGAKIGAELTDLPKPLRFVADFFRPGRSGEAWQPLDLLDWVIFLGVVWVTLKTPFLYDRETTENFLTPKEFWSKQTLALLGVVFALRFLYHGAIKLVRTRLDLPLALFFGLSVLSVAWNYNGPSALRDLRGTFLIMMLFPYIVNSVRNRWQLDGILWAIVFTGIATATLGIMETYNWYYRWDPTKGWVFARDEIFSGMIDYQATYIPLFPQLADKNYSMMSIVSTFGNRNYLGTFTMFTAFIPLAFYFYYNNIAMKAISLGLYGWMLYGLYITRCRAALLGMLVGFAFMTVMLALFDRNWRFVKRNIAFFVAVGCILAAGFLVQVTTARSFNMLDKIKSTFTMDRTTSNTYERVWVWYATFRSFSHNPFKWLLGSGFGSYKHFFPLQEANTFDDDNKETFTPVTFRQTHNDWLQLVSELGLVGMGIFLLLVWRFYAVIYRAVKAETRDHPEGEFSGDHVLLIALGAAMMAQLAAAVPDFPFHRIETALYAVVVLALVPVLGETSFFKRPLPVHATRVDRQVTIGLAVIVMVAGVLSWHFERRTYYADTLVRAAEMLIQQRQTPESLNLAKQKLYEAIRIDPLPGDPYLKLSTILEMEGRGKEALEFAEMAWKNINFNARSTYHSVVFRRMHIYYYLFQDRAKALEQADLGRYLTCGEARSIYYFYIGKIAWEMGDLARAESALERAVKFPAFEVQAGAVLAVVKAHLQKWEQAYAIGASVSAAIGGTDPTILDVTGIAASNLGQQATAEQYLRKAVELQPSHPIFKRDLGVTLVRQNRLGEARPLLEDAHAAPNTPPQIKSEVETLLASMSLVEFSQAHGHLKAGRQAEGLAILQGLAKAKVLHPQVREQVKAMMGQAAAAAPAASSAPSSVSSSVSSPMPSPVPAPDSGPAHDSAPPSPLDPLAAPGEPSESGPSPAPAPIPIPDQTTAPNQGRDNEPSPVSHQPAVPDQAPSPTPSPDQPPPPASEPNSAGN